MFFGYGTAYRLTRDGGDNGVALFGWMILMNLVSLIPGLGFFLWHKNRDTGEYASQQYSYRKKPTFMADDNALNTHEKKKSSWKNPYDPD